MSAIDVMTDSVFRENLDRVMEEVADTVSHVIVTRENGRPIVVMAYDELRSWEETLYLMSSRANAEALLESIAGLDAGLGVERDLVDPNDPAQVAAAKKSLLP